MDLAFHLLLIVTTGVGLAGVRRHAVPAMGLVALTGLGFVGCAAAAVASDTGFDFLRQLSVLVFLYLPLSLGIASFYLTGASTVLARWGAVGVVAVGVWAFGVEPRWLEVERIELASAKVEEPLRIAVLADLQTDRFGNYERRALRTLASQGADLVLLTGDYLQAPAGRRAVLADELRSYFQLIGLDAPLGIHAVRGDVETDDWRTIFRTLPVRTYGESTTLELPGLTLTALDARDSRFGEYPVPPRGGFHVVFGHAPDFALGNPPADLLIAGHTHGGQVRLPLIGPLITFSRVPRGWAAGTTRLPGGQTLVVSRGVGMERGKAPRLRFLCRPQIVVIDVVPAGRGPAD